MAAFASSACQTAVYGLQPPPVLEAVFMRVSCKSEPHGDADREIENDRASSGPPPCERCNGKGRVTVVPLSALWKVRNGTNVEPES
jgi:hypothetical protein